MKFPNSPPTLTLAERMPSEICKKHILTGYRRPNQPWIYYVISVFHANNQTLNVWTHVIGFLYIAYRTYDISLTFDMVYDPMFRPLGAGLLCVLALLAVSSFAHTFGDKSEVAHYACFCMDFNAIGIYSMGCALISHTYFTREKGLATFLVKWSRPVCIYLAMQLSVLLSFTKIRIGRNQKLCKIVQFFVVYSSYFWFILPLIQRYFWPSHGYHDDKLGLHVYHLVSFQFNVLVYSAHVPERWFPKLFDIIGQSHQLQHVIMLVSVNNLINVTLEELKSSSSARFIKFMTRKLGTKENSYGAVMLVVYFNCLVIAVATLFAIIKVAQNSKPMEVRNISKDTEDDNTTTCDQTHIPDDGLLDGDINVPSSYLGRHSKSMLDDMTLQKPSNGLHASACHSSDNEYLIDKSQ